MNAIVVLIVGLLVGVLGYRYYSRPVDERVLQADP
jgi:carbon starvation protein CstA